MGRLTFAVYASKNLKNESIVRESIVEILSKEQFFHPYPNTVKFLLGDSNTTTEKVCSSIASKYKIPVKVFEARWNNLDGSVESVLEATQGNRTYNKLAGYNRDYRMLDAVIDEDGAVIAFDDGSYGIKQIVREAKKNVSKVYQVVCKDPLKLKLKTWIKNENF